MMTTEPAVLDEQEKPVITMPGCVFTATGATVFDSCTEAQMGEAVKRVMRLDGAVAWWLGDLGIALQRRKAAEFREQAQELRKQAAEMRAGDDEDARLRKARLIDDAEKLESSRVDQYTSEKAEAWGIDEGYWRHCVMLARFYPACSRDHALSPKHYRVALTAAGGAKGDPDKAKVWLQRARENEWKASDLRRQVNLSLATARPVEAPATRNPFGLLDETEAWLLKKPEFPPVTPTEARAQLVRWQAIISFVKQLETIAARP